MARSRESSVCLVALYNVFDRLFGKQRFVKERDLRKFAIWHASLGDTGERLKVGF